MGGPLRTLGALLLCAALSAALPRVLNPYVFQILMLCGINVILAVSLNLVNGFTGQFSIGHAGFMAVGGYVAGAITYYGSFLLWGGPKVHPGWLSGGDVLFVCGCLVGALVAAGGARGSIPSS